MHPDDRLTAVQLGIDDATRQHMGDAWTAYRSGLAPDGHAQQELFAEWAALDADMGDEAYALAAEQRPGDLDFDPLTTAQQLLLAAMLKDAHLAATIGPVLPASVFEDPGERELYTALISAGEDVRLSAQTEYLAECLRVYVSPAERPRQVAHQLLMQHLREQLAGHQQPQQADGSAAGVEPPPLLPVAPTPQPGW